ncbi:EamA family transporter [Halosquirtibacter xylanolyticus]|uniref:EamA family transporter n=1 Tax=Halosquirtibacter xylanolyticus TaxID=3374599 RepID=UPI00374A629E|nr:EamA family transporter [Prolixibacteraceae bacterium]
MWIYYGLLAALFLGFHGICKKISVKDNKVIPVLFLTSLSGLIFISPIYFISRLQPELAQNWGLYINPIEAKDHLLIFFKSLLMTFSWILGYSALKHLPISIVSPIRAAGPFFTLLGALFIYGESPSIIQWAGFTMILISMWLYSKIGKLEGIDFRRNRWIIAIILATLFGASSGLYDKFLIQYQSYEPQTVQFWFFFYVVTLVGIVLLWMNFKQPIQVKGIQWRWSIPFVGVLLVLADFSYFHGLQNKEAMIMLLSAVKRCQIFIAVFIGGWIFKEKNKKKKLIPLLGVFIGVLMILFATTI